MLMSSDTTQRGFKDYSGPQTLRLHSPHIHLNLSGGAALDDMGVTNEAEQFDPVGVGR